MLVYPTTKGEMQRESSRSLGPASGGVGPGEWEGLVAG